MHCPACRTPQLMMSERQGIEIDYCPQCRGIWLDRGELDKIIERAQQERTSFSPPQPSDASYGSRKAHSSHDSQRGHYRKKSFLEELFD